MSTRSERKRLRAMAAGAVIVAVSSVAAMAPAGAQNLPQAATCTCPSGPDQGVYVPQQETVVRQQTALSQEQLDQILAPIALYPDNLLAQILTASTYPLEVTAAARWSKEHARVSGNALDQAMLRQPWDASVKGLTAVPQVLAMMNEQLDWTEQLGEAFLAQQDDVTRTVQMLRAKAAAAGTLRESKELRVVRTPAPPAPAGAVADVTEYIQIESAAPEIISVPVYDPGVVYGAWSYPNRRPFFWRPPGYAYAGAIGFGAAVTVGSALWTRYDWRERRIWIDPGRYNRFNRTNYAVGTQLGWRYNVQHRGNAPYRNMSVNREYITTRSNTYAPGRPVVVPPNPTVRGTTTVVTPPPQPGRTIGVVTPPPQNVPGRPIPGGTNSPGKPLTAAPNPPAPKPVTVAPNPPAPPAPKPVTVAPKPPAPPAPKPVTVAPKPPAPPAPKPVTVAPKPPAPPAPKPVTVAPKPPAPPAPKPVTVAPKPPVTTAPKPSAQNCRPPSPMPAGWRPAAGCPK